MNNSSLSTNEINGLLSVASVLRFNSALWGSYSLDNAYDGTVFSRAHKL